MSLEVSMICSFLLLPWRRQRSRVRIKKITSAFISTARPHHSSWYFPFLRIKKNIDTHFRSILPGPKGAVICAFVLFFSERGSSPHPVDCGLIRSFRWKAFSPNLHHQPPSRDCEGPVPVCWPQPSSGVLFGLSHTLMKQTEWFFLDSAIPSMDG